MLLVHDDETASFRVVANRQETRLNTKYVPTYVYLVQKCSLKMPGSFITRRMLAKTKEFFLTEDKWKVLSYLRNPMSAQCLPLSSYRSKEL